MPNEELGSAQVKVGLNTVEFNKGMAELSKRMQIIGQDFKLASAGLDKVGDASKIYALKINELTQKIELQKQRITELNRAHAAAVAEYGEGSKAALGYESRLKGAQIALDKLENELKTTTATLKSLDDGWKKAGEAMEAAGKKMQSAGDKMVKFGKSMSMYVTAPIVAAGAAMVKLASDVEESINKVDVSFGDASASVKEWSKTTLESFGIAKGTALDMAATFGDMSTSMGMTQEQAADMSESLVGLAGDLASFKNISIDIANTALTSIFTGETESLKKLGIVMTEVNLQAFAQAEGMKKTYKEMTQAEKVALRYSYVMSMTKNAQGDFARTSGSTANQIRILQESVKELGANLGEELLPIITPIIKQITEWVQEFGKLDEGTKKTILTIAALAAAIGPATSIIGGMTKGVGALIGTVGKLGKAISAAGGLMSWIASGPVIAAIAGIGILVVAISALVGSAGKATDAAKELGKELDETAKKHEDNLAAIEHEAIAANALVDELAGLQSQTTRTATEQARMSALVSQLNEIYPELNLAIDEQTGNLKNEVKAIRDIIAAKKTELQVRAREERVLEIYKEKARIVDELAKQEKLIADAEKLWGDNSAAVAWIMSTSGNPALYDAITATKELNTREAELNAELGRAEEAWGGLITNTKSATVSFWEMEHGVRAATQATSEAQKKAGEEALEFTQEQISAYETYNSQLESMTETHLGQMGDYTDKHIERVNIGVKTLTARLKERNKDFEDWQTGLKKLIGKVAPEALAELEKLGPGYDNVVDGLVAAAEGKKGSGGQKTITDFETEMSKQFGNAKNASLTEMELLVEGMEGKDKEIMEAGKLLADAAKEGLAIDAKPLGEDAGQGLADGIRSKINAIKKAAADAAEAARLSIQFTMEAHSPSRVTEKLGAFFSEGFINGIASKINDIRAVAGQISAAAMPSLSMPSYPSLRMPAMAGATAGAGGESSPVNNYNYSISVNVPGNFAVRSDADIKAISRGIAQETVDKLSAMGVH